MKQEQSEINERLEWLDLNSFSLIGEPDKPEYWQHETADLILSNSAVENYSYKEWDRVTDSFEYYIDISI